jgi:hypothetical protein
VLTSCVPGNEDGNADMVVNAGAGRYAPRLRDLVAEVGRLRRDPAALATMRAASASLSRPEAAAEIASLLALLAGSRSAPAEHSSPGVCRRAVGTKPFGHLSPGLPGYGPSRQVGSERARLYAT